MIPKPVIAVVEAARKVVAARKALSAATKDGETNEAGLARRRKTLHDAVKVLVRAVDELETLIERGQKNRLARGGKGASFPWASFFDAAGKFVDLASKVRAGDRTAVGDAARFVGQYGPGDRRPNHAVPDDEIIDGEFSEVK